MPGPMNDCYVIAPSRSAYLALEFLKHFVPSHEPTWDETDPAEVLGVARNASLEDVLEFLEQNVEREYTMYLRNRESTSPYFAILAYLDDGALIFGLSGDDEEQATLRMLDQLERFAGFRGYWGFEEPPAISREEFLARVRKGNP